MKRLFGPAIALTFLAGCAVWQEEVQANTFRHCSGQAEPDLRRQCIADVRAAAEASLQREVRLSQQREADAEARELTRQVYAPGPGPD